MEITYSLEFRRTKASIWRIEKKLPNVTQKMLTQQLRELEEYGLLNRFIYAQVPPKVEYSLTEEGKSILPILASLCQWGLDYIIKLTD